MKRVLFYSSVKNKELFNIQQFYAIDCKLLEELGYKVILSNRIWDSFCFWKYDFVFAYFYKYSFFVSLIAALFFKHTYLTGGIDKLDPNWATPREIFIQKLFFILCYIVSYRCIIVSKTDLDHVNKILKGHHHKLCYSEHSIDVAKYDFNNIPKENLFTTIAWQGNGNIYRKGLDLALKIYARMLTDGLFADSRFIFIGKEADGTDILRGWVKELGIESHVVFLGAVSEEEKISWLKKSKYYFQLSIYEGFGIAALEALCSGNIVIHSGKGGLSNPIYQDSIIFDRDKDFELEYQKLLVAISSFDDSQLSQIYNRIKSEYCNNRRREDLKKIITE